MENRKYATLQLPRRAPAPLRNSASDSCLESEVISVLVREINDISTEVKTCKIRIAELEKAIEDLHQNRRNNVRSKFDILADFLKLGSWRAPRHLRKSRMFFQRRRSSDLIISEELSYKTDLSSVTKDKLYCHVPRIVVACCELIEEKSKNQMVGGLYRVPGDYAQIKRLRRKITFENNYKCLQEVHSIHTLAGLLKIFFRDIDPPLIKSDEIERFPGLDTARWTICLPRARVRSMQKFIATLPDEYRETLRYFLCHLKKMCSDYPKNLSSQSVAISIGPSILHITAQYRGNIQERLKEYGTLNEYLHFMIDYCDEIFSCNFTAQALNDSLLNSMFVD